MSCGQKAASASIAVHIVVYLLSRPLLNIGQLKCRVAPLAALVAVRKAAGGSAHCSDNPILHRPFITIRTGGDQQGWLLALRRDPPDEVSKLSEFCDYSYS